MNEKEDISVLVSQKNPANLPMLQTDYALWLTGLGCTNVNSLVHKNTYLRERFGYDKERHYLQAEVISVLRCIERYWFESGDRGVLPKPAKRPELVFHYLGMVERGPDFEWKEGFSIQTATGALYPWDTRAECRAMAKEYGMRAVFYRDGKPA